MNTATSTDQGPGIADAVYARVLARSLEGEQVEAAQITALVLDAAPLLGAQDVERVARAVVGRLHGLGVLEALLDDPAVTEVMVNGPGAVWVERDGRLHPTNVTMDAASIGAIIERIVAPLGLRVDRTSPLVDARLPDGSRVNIVVPPLAIDGPYVTIRRFAAVAVPVHSFCSADVAARLHRAVRDRRNIVVSGGTGTGKTTLLNALAGSIGSGERVVTIEDAAELRLPGRQVVRLEARPANGEGVGEVGIRTLLRNALRMRPDRIVVGECRGPEALEMVHAMNTGHAGSLSTCHASSPGDALRRLETMILQADVGLPPTAVRDRLFAAIDMVVQVERTATGTRRIAAVCAVADDGSLTEWEHTSFEELGAFAGAVG